MTRTRPTSTTKLSPKWGTSSGTNPGEDFESPQDISDVVGLDTQIPRGSRTPTGGLLPGKPVPRSPVGLEIGKSAGGGLGVTVAVPIGGPISARGGINIGEGGAIKGAQVGLGIGVGPIGVSIDVGTDRNDAGEGGCYQYVTVMAGPFSHTYGRNVCEPKIPTPAPVPVPTPAPAPVPETPDTPLPPIIENKYIPDGDPICIAIVGNISNTWQYYSGVSWHCPTQYMNDHLRTVYTYNSNISGDIHPDDEANLEQFDVTSLYTSWRLVTESLQTGTAQECSLLEFYSEALLLQPLECVSLEKTVKISGAGNISGVFIWSGSPLVTLRRITAPIVSIESTQTKNSPSSERTPSLDLIEPDTLLLAQGKASHINAYFNIRNALANNRRKDVYTSGREGNGPECISTGGSSYYLQYIVNKFIVVGKKAPLPLSPPVPNSPPTKKMDDKCCQQSLILQVEILRLLGRELGPNGLVPQTTKKGFIGEEFERVETPILDPINPKKVKIKFATVYEMLVYALKQANNLDTALDPQSYKIPTGKLQNPAYNRDSEQSLKSNNQPNKDKAGNKRELEINKDDEAKISGFLQQQSYMFQILRRFEYLFPPGELEDALIAKSLLIPGAKGEVKIHNMIQAYEIQMQYLNSVFGDPRELITIKDANPGLAGDQSIEVKCLSISSMLREIIKFQIDTGGDVNSSMNLAIRIFRTVMANRMDIVKTGEAVQAIFEDTGMLENMDWLDLHLEGDPYAGQWEKGQGFKPNPDLEKKTEEATEKVLLATMIPGDVRIKVSRRSKDEKTDMRDLIRGLADFMQRLLSIPSPSDAANAIDKLIESAKFKVQTDMALIRQNVVKAASATRARTRKKKK